MIGKEVELAFPHPDSKKHCRITGEIVWEGPQGVGLKFESIERGGKGVDLCASVTHQEQSVKVYREVRKMARVRKRRVRWELASSADVRTYRLYWSKDGEVNYKSDHADIGHAPELILPDDIPSFPLRTGRMELGISAINNAGNESDIARISVDFNFEVPDTPQNLKIEEL